MDKFLVLFFLLIFPASLSMLRYFLQLLHLWQIKEYRFDRVFSFMRFEKKYSQLGTLLWFLKISLLLTGFLYILYPNAGYLSFSYIVTYVLYYMQLEWLIMDIINKSLVRPRIKSVRNILISLTVFVFITSIYTRMLFWFLQFNFDKVSFISPEGLTLKNITSSFDTPIIQNEVVIPLITIVVGITLSVTLLIDLLLPLWVSFMVLVTAPLSYLLKKRKIMSARMIINNRGKDLKVVSITGSYGKTTTKELIFEIIKDRFITAKTPENNNTTVGLAQAIKKYIKNDTQVFVVEMGAYKKGEIKESTNLVSPDIAVVTALSQQHVSLFGSSEKLYQAKFELIDGLKDSGLAIFNGNDERCQKMSRETTKSKVFFYKENYEGTRETNFAKQPDQMRPNDRNLYISSVVDLGDVLDIQMQYLGEIYRFKVALKEERFSINLAAAILVALQLGMTMDEIISRISSWDYSVEYLKVQKGINGITILDDGKTSNKEGFIMALDYLEKKFQGKKWVLTQGIIELGNERSSVYDDLASKIVVIADGLITNDDDLIMAVRKIKSDFKVLKINNINGFVDALKFNLNNGEIVLIEGILPQDILNQIIINDS